MSIGEHVLVALGLDVNREKPTSGESEINLEGVNQVHMNPKVGLGFAQALRSFLRQDPWTSIPEYRLPLYLPGLFKPRQS